MTKLEIEVPDQMTTELSQLRVSAEQIYRRVGEVVASDVSKLQLSEVCVDSPMLTPRARKTLLISEDVAHNFNHNTITSTHILAGLLTEVGGIGPRALRDHNVTFDRIRESLGSAHTSGQSHHLSSDGTLVFSLEAADVLQSAAGQALLGGKTYLGTEHLLLGILSSEESMAFAILAELGIDRGHLHITIAEGMADGRPGSPQGDQRVATIEEVATLLDYLRTTRQLEVSVGVGESIVQCLRDLDVTARVRGRSVSSGNLETVTIEGKAVRSLLAAPAEGDQ